MERKRISSRTKVGLALDVNGKPGPIMLEGTCGCGLIRELKQDGMPFEEQASMAYGSGGGGKCGLNYRVDVLIDGKMIVELKGCPPPPAEGSQ